jgi:hypothetical protein
MPNWIENSQKIKIFIKNYGLIQINLKKNQISNTVKNIFVSDKNFILIFADITDRL